MIKLVLFDLDGTLIQSTELIMEAFRVTFKKYFPEVNVDEVITNFLGQTLWVTFGDYINENQSIDDIIAFYRKTSEALIQSQMQAYPNAKETLAYLTKQNIRVGVVTSKMHGVAKEHLALVGLDTYVEHLVGYEDVTLHKPDKEPLTKALSLFNMSPEEAIYIGDHENDIRSAKACEMMSCAVTYSHRLKEMLSYRPDYVIDDLLHIKDIV